MKTFTVLATLCMCTLAFGATIHRSNKASGEMALPGDIPYIVSIRNTNGSHVCSGTILNKKTILTAAGCQLILARSVLLGTTTLNGGGEKHTIAKLINHPEYDPTTLQNDIAILILNKDIEFSDEVQPIPIATKDTGARVVARISGWGYRWDESSISNNLKYNDVKTIENEDCKSYGNAHNVLENQICTFVKAEEFACTADFGGPLVAKGELIGITTGFYRCSAGYPDYFTRVYAYASWIEENIAN